MTSRECVSVFLLAPWKYPAEAPGRVLLGSQDVNVNFLPVTEETLSHSGPGPLPPWSPCLQSKEPFFFPVFFASQSDIEEHLRIGLLRGPGDPTSGGCIDFQ